MDSEKILNKIASAHLKEPIERHLEWLLGVNKYALIVTWIEAVEIVRDASVHLATKNGVPLGDKQGMDIVIESATESVIGDIASMRDDSMDSRYYSDE